jgi:hypothetical protein
MPRQSLRYLLDALRRHIDDALINSDMDLSISVVDRRDPSRWVVRSTPSPVRVFLGLLFDVPCLMLVAHAGDGGMFAAIAALLFCPPPAILAVLFGLARQQSVFEPGLRVATKSFGVFGWRKARERSTW